MGMLDRYGIRDVLIECRGMADNVAKVNDAIEAATRQQIVFDLMVGVLQSFVSAWDGRVFAVGEDDEQFAETLAIRAKEALIRAGVR